ncbi:MAG TPA: hypothetical protein PL193_15405 [Xanthobacteraceae bacterium]|nr:hypothetical protein [Xanthobacteraceae bacterium]
MNQVDQLSNQNYLESIRVHATFQDPCEVYDRDGIFLVAGATSFPGSYWNAGARNTLDVKPKDMDEAARAFFAPKKRMFTFTVIAKQDGDLKDYLLANEYEERFGMPCMSVTRPLPERTAPEGVRVVPIKTLQHVHDFVEASAAAYSVVLPERHMRAMFSKSQAMLHENILGAVAYRGEEPVAAGFALMSGEGADRLASRCRAAGSRHADDDGHDEHGFRARRESRDLAGKQVRRAGLSAAWLRDLRSADALRAEGVVSAYALIFT